MDSHQRRQMQDELAQVSTAFHQAQAMEQLAQTLLTMAVPKEAYL